MLSRAFFVSTSLIAIVFGNVLKEYSSHNIRQYVLESSREKDWWEDAIIYQIYPRSFKDSDGNGFGDLPGITSKLETLKDLGVTAIWISPINKSPGVDQGYDVSDYRDVDPLFGTKEDLKLLLAKAHSLGLKVILDFVPNHTSDKHEWFIKSENRVEGYEDYYIWKDGVSDPEDPSKLTVPNNWLSDFMGSSWEWSEKRQQYYYHQFSPRQVDLNYRNNKVLQEIKDILTYWMDFGIDGFRVDACPYFLEDAEFRDEPLQPGQTYDVNNPACLQHIYSKNQAGSYEVIYAIREHVDEYARRHNTATKLIMSEAYTTIDYTMLFYQSKDGSKQGSHLGFNFNFIMYMQSSDFTVDDILKVIHLWLDNLPDGHVSNWVLGNHDNHRVATRLGKANIDGFNMLTAFLPGVMVTYNGEEIGMHDGQVYCDQGWDPQATKDCSVFDKISRDFERTPYQWDESLNGGFSSNPTYTWLPVSPDYKANNLEDENDPHCPSHLNVYKALAEYREKFALVSYSDTLKTGKLLDTVVHLVRRRDGDEFQYLFNIGDERVTLGANELRYATYTLLVVSSNSNKQRGEIVQEIKLEPHECVILQKVDYEKSS